MIAAQIFSICNEGVKDGGLLDVLFKAHAAAAENNVPVSSWGAINVAVGGGGFDKAVIAAICMTGTIHAPVTAARRAIFHGDHYDIVPGFGNSFYKDSIDPSFFEMDEYLYRKYPDEHGAIIATQIDLNKRLGVEVYPNAAAYTAAVAELINLPEGLEQILFILPRITVWAKQYNENVKR
jgi:citrate synthase